MVLSYFLFFFFHLFSFFFPFFFLFFGQLRVQLAARGATQQLLLLPPYSPELNPAEMVFGKLKIVAKQWRDVAEVRQLEARLLANAGAIITLDFVQKAYESCGYY